jgi:hypothetical protein
MAQWRSESCTQIQAENRGTRQRSSSHQQGAELAKQHLKWCGLEQHAVVKQGLIAHAVTRRPKPPIMKQRKHRKEKQKQAQGN